MPRIVEKLTARPKLRPQADYRETDTYVRPSDPAAVAPPPAANNWMRLGQALQGVQPSITNFLQTLEDERHTKEQEAGEADAAKWEFDQNRKSWGDLVAAHPELQTRDPWYRRGIRTSYLRQRGRDYDLDLRDAYAKSDIKDSDDPEAYQKWQRDFRGQWVKDNIGEVDDHELVESFVPHMEQAEANMGKHHSAIRDQELRTMGREALVNEVYKEFEVELRTLEGNDPVAHQERAMRLGGKIKAVVDNFRLHHLNTTEANQLVIKSIAGMAVEHKDKELLDVLDHIETAPGQLLGKTAIARQLREEAENKILDKTWEDYNRNWTYEKRQEEEQTSEVQAKVGQEMVQAFLSGQDYNPLQALSALSGKYSGRVLAQLQGNIISTWKAMKTVSEEGGYDNQLPAQLRFRIFKQEDVSSDIMMALGAGTLDPAKASQLFDDMQTAKSFKLRFEDDVFQSGETYLRRMLEYKPAGGGDDPEATRLAQAAILRFHDDMAAKMKSWEKEKGSPMPVDKMREEAEKLFVHIGGMEHYQSAQLREAMYTGPALKPGQTAPAASPIASPAEERLRGTYAKSYSPVQVMEMDRSQVNPTKDHLWPSSDQFEQDIDAWEQKPDADSVIVKLSRHLGFENPADFIRAQVKAWNPNDDYLSPAEAQEAELAHKQAQQGRVDEVKRKNAERRKKE